MVEAILDTSFILSCVREKIDFIEEISLMGIKIIVPEEVISEIERFKDEKTEANIALSLLEKSKEAYEKVSIGKGHVDNKILDYANSKNDVIIATLDRELKCRFNGKLMVIRGKKKLEVI